MEERKFKFQKVHFKPKQVGIDIRGGYCSHVRKGSQAYKQGVKTGWRIVNIDGERVPKEDREIASLIRSCIDADDKFAIVFRLPPKDTFAGYKCGDIVEALDSTGRQWNKCLIIDIQGEKFSIVYLHNAVRSKKFQAMLRRLRGGDGDEDDEWDEDFDDELDDKPYKKKANGTKSTKKNRKKKKKNLDDVEIDSAVKKLMKAAIGKEAKAEAKEMKKEYARVAASCSDEGRREQVFAYLEGKLKDIKHPSRVLKALLLSSYLIAYGDDNTSNQVVEDLSDSMTAASEIDTQAKTAAGKSAVSDIQNRVGPAALQLLDASARATVRASVKKQATANMTLAPPPNEGGGATVATTTAPAIAGPPSADVAFNNLSALTANVTSEPLVTSNAAPKPEPLGGIDLGALFAPDPSPATAQQHQRQQNVPTSGYSDVNFLSQGMSNMNMGGGGAGFMQQQQQHQPQQQQQPNLWNSGLVDLGLGTQPRQQPQEKKVTLQQMQGEEVDLFNF